MEDTKQVSVLTRSRARLAHELGDEPASAGEQISKAAQTLPQSRKAQSHHEAAEQLPRSRQEAVGQLPQNCIDLRSRMRTAVEAVEQRPRVATRSRKLVER